MKARSLLPIVLAVYFFVPMLVGARTADVIAFQAPDCRAPVSPYCTAFITNVLPHLSGIGVTVPWIDIDDGTTAPHFTSTVLDAYLNAYIHYPASTFHWDTGCVNGSACKIVLIIQPENDSGGVNRFTPQYVFTQAVQDVAACSEWPGTGSDRPFGNNDPQSGDFIVWNKNSCHKVAGNLECSCTSNCNFQNFTGFPVVYEQPILQAYQAILTALSGYYSTGGGGQDIGNYISYVRAGMATGGENLPRCAVTDSLSLPDWHAAPSVPIGYVITPIAGNPNQYTFVSLTSGPTGLTPPPSWTQTPGDTTQDNQVTWENVGQRGSGGTAVWPGPNGLASQPSGYTDNGYLSHWDPPGPVGYIAKMVQFLGTRNSSFKWDISSHYGPELDISYADSEAGIVNALGNLSVGFGMQSLNVGDPVLFQAGNFPTSREDWAANFTSYGSVPVRHLQTNDPGTTHFAAGFQIDHITGNPTNRQATITCVSDCISYATQEIVIIGNGPFDGTYQVLCNKQSCGTNTLTIASALGGTFSGGIVWSPNYWPNTLDFAVNTVPNGATSIEVYECDLDYAFAQVTTVHVSLGDQSSGCADWGVSTPSDPTYAHEAAKVQGAIP